jgi:hypothetical protein
MPKRVQCHEVLYCYVCVSLVKGQKCSIQQFLCWVLIILKSQLLTNEWKTKMRHREVWWEEYKICVSVCVSRDQLLATSFKLRETSVWKWGIKLTKEDYRLMPQCS